MFRQNCQTVWKAGRLHLIYHLFSKTGRLGCSMSIVTREKDRGKIAAKLAALSLT